MDARVDELLEGPRGRRMLHAFDGGREPLSALADAVAWAAYWQPPDDIDDALAEPARDAGLREVADRLLALPAPAWWWHPLSSEQFVVRFFRPDPETREQRAPAPPDPHTTAEQLESWHRGALADEAQFARYRARHPHGELSGAWWSLAQFTGVWSTGSLGAAGATGLHFVEDGMGWDRARVWPVRAQAGARVLEIDGPDAWAELCRRYPLDVSESRRHTWRWTTSRLGRWVLPDWPAVATEWDAVHVTGAGYLRTAGRAIPVDGSVFSVDGTATVLAGWNPGETVWLTDAVDVTGDPVDWVRDDDVWRPTTT